MRVTLTSVPVDDQARAERFYTEVLGFQTKHPAVAAYRSALVEDGIPLAQFTVDDVRGEHERLTSLGVRFTQEPTDMGPVTTAVFDDTCGNLIQIAQQN